VVSSSGGLRLTAKRAKDAKKKMKKERKQK
jgi:hypothetical protein